jgi:hypothetical protein
MKNYILILISLAAFAFTACDNNNDNEKDLGNPTIALQNQASQAFFGDSLPFIATVSDNVPLSTLKADLYFGEEIVSTTTIRTKENGDYTGKIYIPFYANIPNGTATLEFTLTNTHLGKVTQDVNLPVSRPIFPYLILVSSDGTEYPMTESQAYPGYIYVATASFPTSDLRAYIKTPAYGENGNELTFGWNGSSIEQGLTDNVPFASPVSGVYSVTFNTQTFEATPFLSVKINGTEMTRSGNNFTADLNLTSGQELSISGIGDIQDWWIDPDWFTTSDDNSQLSFKAISGKYRIIADFAKKWFRVEVMNGNDLATLQPDGTGAIWVIGDNVGKPSLANTVGWTTDNALCMVPEGNGKYHITLVAGTSVDAASINFKFFYQKGWGGEFDSPALTSASNLVFVGDGTAQDYQGNTRDNGNLGLLQALEIGATYDFTVDVSGGLDKAVLSVVKK